MRPVKDLYKPGVRPGKERNGKPERLFGDHPERTAFCLDCKHPGKTENIGRYANGEASGL